MGATSGVEFRLSDYRGRVVVLMFSVDWCGACKYMYPFKRKLKDKFQDKPFAVLGVMADEKIETVKIAYHDGDIRWRVWCDGANGPIATNWNIKGFPTVYTIDQEGVIRHRNLWGEPLEKAVEEMLQAIDPSGTIAK